MSPQPTQGQIQRLIQLALEEDLGSGDITTDNIVSRDVTAQASMTAKEDMVICGISLAQAVFSNLDPEIVFDVLRKDEESVSAGEQIVSMQGRAAALLKGERTALNLLQHLSGIATLTRQFVAQAGAVKILDTRKTTAGLRVFEKYAVHCGGGTNHRFGLFDAVLIKDNHIKIAGGIGPAVKKIKNRPGVTGSVEVETTNLKEVREALEAGADIIMLDNMDMDAIRNAVGAINGKARIEVSGSVDLERVAELAATGIDYISVGALTHSAPAVDISMNFDTVHSQA